MYNSEMDTLKPAYTADSMGGRTEAWKITHRRVRCRFGTPTRREMLVAYDTKTVLPDFYIYTDYLSDVNEGDRITSQGRTFEIKLAADWDLTHKYWRLAVVELTEKVD
jgi:SPP1 family predicted phage head-tail adaptor